MNTIKNFPPGLSLPKPSWWILPFDPPLDLTWVECRIHCQKVWGKTFIDIFLEYIRIQGYYANLYPDGLTDDEILKECIDLIECPDESKFDPLLAVVEVYNLHYKEDFHWCLDHKASYHDCVYGCYCGFMEGVGKHRHPHQCCVKTQALEALETNLISNPIPKEIESFESLFEEIKRRNEEQKINYFSSSVQKNNKEIWNYGNLGCYDTALRMVWHHPERERLLPKRIHLYQGPLWGARSLWNIRNIIAAKSDGGNEKIKERFGNMGMKPKYGETIQVSALPIQFHSLQAYELENLLCICHDLFFQWENILRKKIGMKLRKGK